MCSYRVICSDGIKMILDKKVETAHSTMDTKIEPSIKPWMIFTGVAFLIVILLIALYFFIQSFFGTTLRVKEEDLTISRVTTGQFDNFIRIRASVEPFQTYYLDTEDGGRVKAVYVENGETVEKGDLLIDLSNSDLQLNVFARETEVEEQFNNMRSQELALERNRLSHKRELIEIGYRIKQLEVQIERTRPLVEAGTMEKSFLEDLLIEHDYLLQKREVSLESQKNDILLQEQQLSQLRKAIEQLERNLEIARRNLEGLSVRAPISGKLTAFELKEGQSVARGQRIGQVDDPNQFRLSAHIDQFYINDVKKGQTADIDVQGKNYVVEVIKIYPQVIENRFRIDLNFKEQMPNEIKRGQTLQGRLQLGDSYADALLIDLGPYYQRSAGEWVFLVSTDGTKALKTPVKLGRRNPSKIEVLEGLKEGDDVIVSTYEDYDDFNQLNIKPMSD
jgi:HlyD family secretion protein